MADIETPHRGPEGERVADLPSDDPWCLWGPYQSGRQWGTVREDYAADGDAWNYFPFDQAHARAYRWGEDGIAGLCDSRGFLHLSLALWNTHDDRLKERWAVRRWGDERIGVPKERHRSRRRP